MNARAVLTKREAQIAELLAWGAAKKEVADRLILRTFRSRRAERTEASTPRKRDDETPTIKPISL